MAKNPQPEHGYVKLANELWNELIRRNFTKRQKDILLFIWRLSYGCNLKEAFIPKLKDFEVCGIPATHIKKELLFLENAKVITWQQSEKLFSINKDYDFWQINPVVGWDFDRFNALIHQNLKRKTSQNVNFSQDQSGASDKDDKLKTSQNVKSDFTKHEVLEGENFTKREVVSDSNPCGSGVEGVSKDMFKDNIKDNSCCLYTPDGEPISKDEGMPFSRQDVPVTPEQVPSLLQDQVSTSVIDYRNAVADKYLQRRGKGLEITISDDQVIDELIKESVPLQTVLDGIDQAFDKFKPKHKRDEVRTLSYCAPVIYSLHAARLTQHENEGLEADSKETVPDHVGDSGYTDEDVQAMLEQLKAQRVGGD